MPSDISYTPLPSHNGPGGFHRTSSSSRNRLTALFTRKRFLVILGILSTLLLVQLYFFSDDILTPERLAVLKSYAPWQHPPAGAPPNVELASMGPVATVIPTSAAADKPAAIPLPSAAVHADENKGFAPLQASHHLGPEAFPPAYKGTPPPWDELYPDGNPHHGVIPARLLAVLEKEPVSHRPPRPPTPPTITAEMWKSDIWDPAKHGSKTSFEDNERADMQPIEHDWRDAPWNWWRPPLSDLRKEASGSATLPKVQFPFSNPSRYSGNSVDQEAEELAKKRQRLVRNAFIHAWEGYKALAWGHDELRPVSGRPNDNFNGWGATPVDVLDTLLIMDLPQEYDYARQHTHDIDFHLVGGGRSAYGSADGQIPVFETAIRYLGGLLSAYDLSGDELMKHRAEELAQLIMPAFGTTSGVPVGRIRMQKQQSTHLFSGSPVLAEVGSLLLEFTRLWQVTGNRTYFDRVQRVTDYLDKNITAGRTGSLFGVYLHPEQHSTSGIVSFGGMADSYYEYLIKQYQLMGGRLKQYGRMYAEAIDSARQYLMRDVSVVPNAPSLFNIGETYGAGRSPTMKLEHLSSFAGGMLGLGSKLLPERASDLELAIRYSETCYWAYNSSTTGIGPEDLIFDDPPSKRGRRSLSSSSTSPADGDEKRGLNGGEGSTAASAVGSAARAIADAVKSIVLTERQNRQPTGMYSHSPSYRNRPETIESVFYMWRITGDPAWRERGWQMFSSWVVHSMTDHGFSSLASVYEVPASKTDSQESYTFAETFKYYYLLFSPPELISLDHYVFTTEAHPLLVPQNGAYTRPGQGPRKFWTPTEAGASVDPHVPDPASGLYSGGENGPVGGLTHVQKAFVYEGWKTKHARRSLLEIAERSEEEGTPRALMQALVEASQHDQAAHAEAAAQAGGSPTDAQIASTVQTVLDAEVLQTVLKRLEEADRVAEEMVQVRVWDAEELLTLEEAEERDGLEEVVEDDLLEREEEDGHHEAHEERALLSEADKLQLLNARAEEKADVERFVSAIRAILQPTVAAASATSETSTTAVQQRSDSVVEEPSERRAATAIEPRTEVVEDRELYDSLWAAAEERQREERDAREVLFEEKREVFHDADALEA
ncbi:hypothetical protein OC834_000309 [Tilletia horrida]|nr:hypothetical protein OC834_000309 [Tilletia horrida]